jgi:hypothetical protein
MAARGGAAARGFSVSIEVGTDGWATVWVPGLLGLFLNEPSERRALGRLPGTIVAYLRWLRHHGERIRVTTAPAVTTVRRYEIRSPMRWGRLRRTARF